MKENVITRVRRPLVFPMGDRIAFLLGVAFTLLLAGFFTKRMMTSLSRDRTLSAVPASTPTPPPPPPPSGH
jgi:hypothetical protein